MINEDYTLLRQRRRLNTSVSDEPGAPAHYWEITEPTIRQYLQLRRWTKTNNISALLGLKEYAVRHWLMAGQRDAISLDECEEILKTVLDMCDQQVLKPLKSAKDEEAEHAKGSEVYDLPLLRALDMIGRRYGMLPQDLAKRLTLRQLHYLYYLAYNAELDDQERQVLLAGGKLKERAERLELIAEDNAAAAGGHSTAGMSIAEKAAYFSRQRRAEGREPGREGGVKHEV